MLKLDKLTHPAKAIVTWYREPPEKFIENEGEFWLKNREEGAPNLPLFPLLRFNLPDGQYVHLCENIFGTTQVGDPYSEAFIKECSKVLKYSNNLIEGSQTYPDIHKLVGNLAKLREILKIRESKKPIEMKDFHVFLNGIPRHSFDFGFYPKSEDDVDDELHSTNHLRLDIEKILKFNMR